MRKILVIRRDNIGDLVCTTPLIRALRERFPSAQIDALVNSYNISVVSRNRDLDSAYAYTKFKHIDPEIESFLGVAWRRICLMWRLRRTRYDLVVLANGGCLKRPLRLARLIRPKHILGFYDPNVSGADIIDMRVAEPARHGQHEVQVIFSMLSALGSFAPPGPLVLNADSHSKELAIRALHRCLWHRHRRPVLAVHISARKSSQRWPAERFVECLVELAARHDVEFILFWSPGEDDHPMHPGDDRKAQMIIDQLPAGFQLLPWPTEHLEELIGGLSICDGMLCSDGGAMHIGAALGLPIVCFFGQSDAQTWYPWGVTHQVIQPHSKEVSDVTSGEAVAALHELWPAFVDRSRQRSAMREAEVPELQRIPVEQAPSTRNVWTERSVG